jgi:hypothetical protein
VPAAAQNYSILPYAKAQFFDSNGHPLAGGKVCSYQAGTSTPLATYADSIGTVNSNPVTLDGAGRANIWLGTSGYKIVLQDSTGTAGVCNGNIIWTVDNVTVNLSALLALNNTWTGTNSFSGATTFNAGATFNAAITSAGPNTLNGGGSMAGTWTGSPTFSGTPNFSSGFSSTTGTFSGQITSTLATGTAPFSVASTTVVPNLNVSQLLGCTWAVPCPIGSTTPNSGAFTTLNASTNFTLAGRTVSSVVGTDTGMMSAGSVSGAPGTGLCIDGNSGATTLGCAAGHVISLGTNSSVCSTTSSAGSTCTTVVTLSPTQADTAYIANCNGISLTGYPFIIGLQKTTTQITVTISNGSSSQAVVSTFAELDCSAIHP